MAKIMATRAAAGSSACAFYDARSAPPHALFHLSARAAIKLILNAAHQLESWNICVVGRGFPAKNGQFSVMGFCKEPPALS